MSTAQAVSPLEPQRSVRRAIVPCVLASSLLLAVLGACSSDEASDDGGASGAAGEGSSGEGASGQNASGSSGSEAGSSGSEAGSSGSEAGSSGSDPDAGNEDSGTSVDTEDLFGGFIVNVQTAESDDETSFTSLLGRLYDREPPPSLPIALEDTEGECELWVPTHPFCDPPCSDGSCTEDSVCSPFAVAQDVGEVSVSGLGEDFTLSPLGSSATYQPVSALPYPPCEEGAEVSVSANDFSLATRCIEPLIVPDADPIEVLKDQPVELRWEPPGMPEVSRMHIALDISHHGGAKGEIVCDVPDTGAYDIPAGLVTQLIELGVAGYPDVVLSRESIGTSEEAPNVALKLSAAVQRLVDTGIPSCTTTADCPDELECDTNLFICN